MKAACIERSNLRLALHRGLDHMVSHAGENANVLLLLCYCDRSRTVALLLNMSGLQGLGSDVGSVFRKPEPDGSERIWVAN